MLVWNSPCQFLFYPCVICKCERLCLGSNYIYETVKNHQVQMTCSHWMNELHVCYMYKGTVTDNYWWDCSDT